MTENQADGLNPLVGERRKHRRYFVDLPVDCCVIENKRKGPIHVGMAENAGTGGLSVYLNERVSPGNQLILELYYRDDYKFSSLKILTEVVWNSEERETPGYKHGVKLLRLENGGNQKLRSLLKRCPILM
jgi:hypothetical protein